MRNSCRENVFGPHHEHQHVQRIIISKQHCFKKQSTLVFAYLTSWTITGMHSNSKTTSLKVNFPSHLITSIYTFSKLQSVFLDWYVRFHPQALEHVNGCLRKIDPKEKGLFNIVLMSHNNAQCGVRIIKSINYHGKCILYYWWMPMASLVSSWCNQLK